LLATRADHSVVERHFTAAAGETSTLTFEDAPPPPPSQGQVPQPPQQPPVPVPPVEPGQPPRRAQPAAMPTWSVFAMGTSTVLATLGAAIYIKFVDDRADFEASFDRDAALHATAEGERTATYVLWGASLASALAAGVGYVFFRGASRSEPSVRVGPGWVSAGGSF
jgi:hypothetical protein